MTRQVCAPAVKEMEFHSYNPILCFKPQGENQPNNMENVAHDDFLLGIQTEFQRDMLLKYGDAFAEYVAEFSGQTEAPEMRCDLDRHTHIHTHTHTHTHTHGHRHGNYRNPRCACTTRVLLCNIFFMHVSSVCLFLG